MKHWLRHPTLTLAVSAALALASGAAGALGLGQIEVRSRAGQPLLAEIPIVSTVPGELDELQARLASPETFARIGLQPPQGVVDDLRFDITSDRNGRPIIRVTTERPIQQPLLTFLVEVDWGQGRLVREYSALIDTPSAIAAPVQPPIQAPTAAPSNTIQRPVGASQRPAGPASQRPESGEQQPTAAASVPGEYGPVQRGETLAAITSRLGLADGASLNQAMIAMLRANPDAFIEGDINRLRRGAVLRVPAADEVAAVDAAQASQIVRDRMRQWREARRQAVVDAAPPQAEASPRATGAPAAAKPAAPSPAAAAPRAGADARLEIVPPAANRAAQAGTQSGQQAGGEGTMLQQELQQTRETLAARDAELQELRSRVAELEKLQTDQQRLLALRNEELAAAQTRLAAPAATATPSQPPREADGGSVLPWILGGAALLALALAAWWARRRPAASAFRAPSGSTSSDLASAFPSRQREGDLLVVPPHAGDASTVAPVASSHAGRDDEAAPDEVETVDDDAHAGPAAGPVPVIRVDEHDRDIDADAVHAPAHFEEHLRDAPSSAPPQGDPADESDDWTGPDLEQEDAPHEDEDAGLPAWHSPRPAPASPVEPTPAPMPLVDPVDPTLASGPATEAPLNERIELAQAYLDLGDYDSARQLLGEVAVTGDHASKQRAVRMLREIE